MDQYKNIRYLYAVEGLSQREIARRLGISRNTVRRYCHGENIPGKRKKPSGDCSRVITPEVRQFVNDCLEEDKNTDPKQRHTAHNIYKRLKKELDFQGAESTVRRLVSQLRAKRKEVFVPLAFSPGEAVQVDWGTAKVIMGGKKITVNLLCFRLCYSCAPFVIAYPSQREEAFYEGHKMAFEFFGGVPKTLIYDNLKTAVKDGWGKTAKEQDKFLAFRAHYAYKAKFCNIQKAHEKGLVEGLVGLVRRNALVPMLKVKDWDELNQLLREYCLDYIAEHHIQGREMPVNDSFAIEKAALTPLPLTPYETARISEPKVNYFSTVSFDSNQYSVPVRWANHTVTVKGSAFEVEIYHRGEKIAQHKRCYSCNKTIYQVEHYIPLLEKKPGAVFHARPVRQANLPDEIWSFAKHLTSPDKGMVRLLRLIADHGLERVIQAIRKARQNKQYSIEIVGYYIDNNKKELITLDNRGPQVKAVDISRYDQFLNPGGGLN